MEDKCNFYEVEYTKLPCPHTGKLVSKRIEHCLSMMENDLCSCGGDKIKCSIYPKDKVEAKKKIVIEEAINHFKHGITHDIFSEPVTSYAKMAVEALEKMR